MYYKFDTKKEAIVFCQLVNEKENFVISEDKVTTGYCQPIDLYGAFYVIADEVTAKYTDKTPIDLDESKESKPDVQTGTKLLRIVDNCEGIVEVYVNVDGVVGSFKFEYTKDWTRSEIINLVKSKLSEKFK